MKKILTVLLAVLISVGLLGCNAQQELKEDQGQESAQEVVQISVLNADGETLMYKDVSISPGETLLTVMDREFEIVDQGGGFITAINEVEVDEENNLWLIFEVNGEPSPVGASDVVLEEGDEVVWILQDFS